MKEIIKLAGIAAVIVVAGYFALGYFSNYMGWYGYRKWEHRVATTSIDESKKRGVFVKELKFTVDSFAGSIQGFKPYIEKGFKFGRHSMEETVPLTGSDYPYQLSYNFQGSSKMGLLLRKSELIKFDSANSIEGYLKTPELKDTIIVDILGENIPPGGFIKIYQ